MSQKGSQYERDMCRMLSLWWTDQRQDDVFWRVRASGGRATTRAKKGLGTSGQCGDIFACDPKGAAFTNVFTVELKKGYTRFSPFDVMDPPLYGQRARVKQLFDRWYLQVKAAHESAGSLAWLIIFRRNRRRDMVVFPQVLYELLKLVDGTCELKQLKKTTPRLVMAYRPWAPTYQTLDPIYLTIMPLKKFLGCMAPYTIKQMAEL